MIHTVKDFSVVNEAEVDVFLKFSYFFYDAVDIGNLISGSSDFLNSACTLVVQLEVLGSHTDDLSHCISFL